MLLIKVEKKNCCLHILHWATESEKYIILTLFYDQNYVNLSNLKFHPLCHTKSSFFWKSPSCQLIKTHISNSNKHRQFVVLIIIIINICIFWRKCMKNHTLWLCPLPNDEEDGVHVGNDWGADFGDKPAISSSQFSSSYMMTRKYQQLTQIINKN